METIRLEPSVRADGTILLENLPIPPGQKVIVDVTVTWDDEVDADSGAKLEPLPGTIDWILSSGAIGMWKDRDDIPDGPEYARVLRKRVRGRKE